ncbi:MAG TPA: tRNA (N(6)-L-threonylcarbamoyladenosine(37)-C(2))-methylthiotransferase MtaB, partial [Armatimonadota bacterium]|nr:tRNA (N(6)-L-threonylcarbamoyladenosine(37)-C(2))-methylthiotransferase MtaB [Armatimonadota bacterium]
MPRVALRTLGCKVNQYESQKIAEDFRSKGFELVDFSNQADVYVVNTCTVTQIADSKSRQAARSAVNRNPRAAVVLTGCYAETSPEQLQAIAGVALVLGN